MKKLLFVLLVFLILPVVVGQDWLQSGEYLISLNMGSEFSLAAETEDYKVEYISVMLSFFPENGLQQEVLNLETEPEAKRINHDYEFKWLDPEEGDYGFNLKAEVKTKNYKHKVAEKIYFPVSVGEEYQEWLESSELIESDDASIIQQASDIAKGNDDLYDVVHDLAKWVNENVEYDIAYGKDFEKASWVLHNKRGTCDEYTTLFIAMCRSLGIPAKYVGGIAYSNIHEIEGFASHAWAEVYFPDYGWIPFDTTYWQFGFVDASHVILKEFINPDESSTTYEWKGLDADLNAKKLQINASLIKHIPGKKISFWQRIIQWFKGLFAK